MIGPGWYDSPTEPGLLRWWDGGQWTQPVVEQRPVPKVFDLSQQRQIAGVYTIKVFDWWTQETYFYIGETTNVAERWATHKWDLEHHQHHCWQLQEVFDRTSRDPSRISLVFVLLEQVGYTSDYVQADKFQKLKSKTEKREQFYWLIARKRGLSVLNEDPYETAIKHDKQHAGRKTTAKKYEVSPTADLTLSTFPRLPAEKPVIASVVPSKWEEEQAVEKSLGKRTRQWKSSRKMTCIIGIIALVFALLTHVAFWVALTVAMAGLFVWSFVPSWKRKQALNEINQRHAAIRQAGTERLQAVVTRRHSLPDHPTTQQDALFVQEVRKQMTTQGVRFEDIDASKHA